MLAAAAAAAPSFAKDLPKPDLSLDPIVARNLLAPVDDARAPAAGYRIDPGIEAAKGQRARLSIDLGDATVFAITGRLERRPAPSGPIDPAQARALGQGRADNGKVYGAGVSSTVRGVDLSATYQYSKLGADRPGDDSQARDFGPGRSHSLKATARIRFRP